MNDINKYLNYEPWLEEEESQEELEPITLVVVVFDSNNAMSSSHSA